MGNPLGDLRGSVHKSNQIVSLPTFESKAVCISSKTFMLWFPCSPFAFSLLQVHSIPASWTFLSSPKPKSVLPHAFARAISLLWNILLSHFTQVSAQMASAQKGFLPCHHVQNKTCLSFFVLLPQWLSNPFACYHTKKYILCHDPIWWKNNS